MLFIGLFVHSVFYLPVQNFFEAVRVKRIFSFTDNDIAKVEVDIEKLSAAIATEKPHGIFIAHNHLSGNPNPSLNDDRFTIELQVMCSMNNVNLYDHCIYASDRSAISPKLFSFL